MKLGMFTDTANLEFVGARRRIQQSIDELKQLLTPVALEGRYNNVLVTFVDKPSTFQRVTQRGKNDNIYEVDLGFDFTKRYPEDDDVLVIQLLEEKLKQIIEGDEGFSAKREELIGIITDWTTHAIGAS